MELNIQIKAHVKEATKSVLFESIIIRDMAESDLTMEEYLQKKVRRGMNEVECCVEHAVERMNKLDYIDWWYLREGDFRPEPVNETLSRELLVKMQKLGNLFQTRDEAEKASDQIRKYFSEWKRDNQYK